MRKNQKVIFVIYGRDDEIYRIFKKFVHKYSDAEIISLKETGPTGIVSVRTRVADCLFKADYCVALASQDDIGFHKEIPTKSENRCRQNVLFELGAAIQALGNKNCAVIRHSSVVFPSDLGDITYIAYNSVNESAIKEDLTKQFEYWGILRKPNPFFPMSLF